MTPEEKAAAAQAASDAVVEINKTVESVSRAVRERITRAVGAAGPVAETPMAAVNTSHATVHSLISGGSKAIGSLSSAALNRWSSRDAPSLSDSPRGLAGLSALGAAFGDRLPEPLAPPMSIQMASDVVGYDTAVVFVHGLGSNEQAWAVDYAWLCAFNDAVPVFVRYTTGRAVDANASELSCQLQHLVESWPDSALRRIVLVGHSMGGLVSARALQTAPVDNAWTPLVTDLVTLGSPLAGAALERFSDATLNTVIEAFPTWAPIAELGHHRSVGIKDLGDGIHDPIPPDVHHTAVVAAVGGSADALPSRLVGDGIVDTQSARGRHADATSTSVVELFGLNHMSLLNHDGVTGALRDVLAAD